MREIFKAESTGDELFFFKGREFPTLMAIYARAQVSRVVRDYNIDGNAVDFVCFSMLTDARAKGAPVLSFEKSKDKGGNTHYKLHSRASGALKSFEGSFVKLGAQMDKEIAKLKQLEDRKIVRVNFGRPRP